MGFLLPKKIFFLYKSPPLSLAPNPHNFLCTPLLPGLKTYPMSALPANLFTQHCKNQWRVEDENVLKRQKNYEEIK